MARAMQQQTTKYLRHGKSQCSKDGNQQLKAWLEEMQEKPPKTKVMATANVPPKRQPKPKAWLEQMQEKQVKNLRHG